MSSLYRIGADFIVGGICGFIVALLLGWVIARSLDITFSETSTRILVVAGGLTGIWIDIIRFF